MTSEVAVDARMPARLIGILGMHRSGTSCLTGSLQQAGLELGDAHTWNPHNLKGNRENQQFVDLHDAILEANGGSWNNPVHNARWSPEHIQAGKQLLADHAHAPLFGFKDPRALLALDGWKRIYPGIEFVGIFRHPNAVARSLARRSGMIWYESMDLWYAYNTALYRQYLEAPFPLLNFDDDEETLDRKIVSVLTGLGLSRDDRGERFYSSELKHNTQEGGPSLPWKVRRLYRKLLKAVL